MLHEADYMADLGFLPVVRRLLDMTPPDGQRMLFSATVSWPVAEALASSVICVLLSAAVRPRPA